MNLPLRQSNWMGWMGAGQGYQEVETDAMPLLSPAHPSGLTGPSQSISLSGAPCAWASLGEPLRRGRCLAESPAAHCHPTAVVLRMPYQVPSSVCEPSPVHMGQTDGRPALSVSATSG